MQKVDTAPLRAAESHRAGPSKALDAFLRRFIDILGAIAGLCLLAPFYFFIAAAIKRDSPGPILYRGPRSGLYGREFRILKFRTMTHEEASANGSLVTSSTDPRVTDIGRWLRDTKINELPQFWNVLKGEMSLVGPRPEDPKIVQEWPTALRQLILSVRPGITSPATILYRSEEGLFKTDDVMGEYLKEIMPTKIRLDYLYVRNRSLVSDMDVIFMTVVTLIPRLRQWAVPESILFWGPLSRLVTRYLSWFVIDTVIAFAAMAAAGLIWRTGGPLDVGIGHSLLLAVLAALLFSLINYFLGLGHVAWQRAHAFETFYLALSTGVTTTLLTLWHHYITRIHIPSGLLIVAGILAFFGFVGVRYRERLFTGVASRWITARGKRPSLGERVLLVGAGNNSAFATWLLTRTELAPAFSIVGLVDDDPRKVHLVYEAVPVLGTTRQIQDLVRKHEIGLLVYTISNISRAERERILAACRESGATVVILPDVMAQIASHFKIENRKAWPEEATPTP